MPDLLELIAESPEVQRLTRELAAGHRVVATGAVGSATVLIAGVMARRSERPTIVVLAHLDDADEAEQELAGLGVPTLKLPALEILPGESNINPEMLGERLGAIKHAAGGLSPSQGLVVITTIQSLMQLAPRPTRLETLIRTVSRGDELDPQTLIKWLAAAGYERSETAEEPGLFAVRGGIIDVFPIGATPVRLDFFGDTLEKLSEIDLDTMASDRAIDRVEIVCADEKQLRTDEGSISFLELLPRESVVIIGETIEVTEQGRGYFERVSDPRGIVGPPEVFRLLGSRFHALAEVNQFSAGATSTEIRLELPSSPLPQFPLDVGQGVRELLAIAGVTGERRDAQVMVLCQNEGEIDRLRELLVEQAAAADYGKSIEVCAAYLHRGFVWSSPAGDGARVMLLPYHELVHRYHTRRRESKIGHARAMDTFLDFAPGDFVVHIDHGIARYDGLRLMKSTPGRHDPLEAKQAKDATGDVQEYLVLEFAGKAKLYVPVTAVDQVQKYIGGFSGKPPLSTLGGERWKGQKARVAESVRDLAGELLRVRAAREHMAGLQFPADTPWQLEFEAQFPYDETPDQLAAIQEIKKDMGAGKPMDRLICGDVGFGKTELAIRAAFKACEFGKQVAVLVPTTVLAEQHERTFKARFAGYPFRIESLSRFKSDREANGVLASLRRGQVDLVIGTHRLLSGDVKFADLGLVIVDEEQRFGVEHKERLLRLRLTVDVLTLSATPIPRTLHMAMLGLRDISSLTTPPLDRRAIVTEVIPYNERRIEQAIRRELAREGQVYFVHNRVGDIRTVADDLQRLAPDARIVVGHGQMDPHELEDVMLKFMRREANILVSTTIIESGIDNPTANTMIITDADRFGLADLHQLRGRVGRSKHRAYCYLLLPKTRPVREVAQKRLKAIEQYSMLGAGFKIAMRDLEIRGAGNLLGAEQSGHIAAVGYEMYCRLLEEAVKTINDPRAPAEPSRTTIDLGVIGTIPRAYIPSDQRRLEAYRRLAVAATPEDLAKVREDLLAAYGEWPKATERLFDLAALRIEAARLGVRSIVRRDQDVVLRAAGFKEVAQRLELAPSMAQSSSKSTSAVRITALPPKSGESLGEVYVRPPERYFEEPIMLLRMLTKRMSGSDATTLAVKPIAAPASGRR
jgi:transcription-repair coupling factor (superfamily II helicase)